MKLLTRKLIAPTSYYFLLISEQTNPYTREPLTMDQVTPDVELKKRIDAFVAEKVAKMTAHRSAAAAAAAAEPSASETTTSPMCQDP